jgi:hypothetical protein
MFELLQYNVSETTTSEKKNGFLLIEIYRKLFNPQINGHQGLFLGGRFLICQGLCDAHVPGESNICRSNLCFLCFSSSFLRSTQKVAVTASTSNDKPKHRQSK